MRFVSYIILSIGFRLMCWLKSQLKLKIRKNPTLSLLSSGSRCLLSSETCDFFVKLCLYVVHLFRELSFWPMCTEQSRQFQIFSRKKGVRADEIKIIKMFHISSAFSVALHMWKWFFSSNQFDRHKYKSNLNQNWLNQAIRFERM